MQELFQNIHLYSFVIFFLFILGLEFFFPLREKKWNMKKRWLQNWSLSILNTLVIRVLSFVTPVWFALYVENQWWGILNNVSLSFWIELIITIFILDFAIYLQHVASHKWDWFWKLHQIHHSDEALDVSTALRFHIGEISISLLYKVALVWIFGFSAMWIAIFEIILVCSAIFNHANLKLPKFLEKYMSYILVTPQFHQVHHSVIHTETDSNYWFFFSFWDRLCKTYTPHQFLVKKLGLNYAKEAIHLKDLLLLKIRKNWK